LAFLAKEGAYIFLEKIEGMEYPVKTTLLGKKILKRNFKKHMGNTNLGAMIHL